MQEAREAREAAAMRIQRAVKMRQARHEAQRRRAASRRHTDSSTTIASSGSESPEAVPVSLVPAHAPAPVEPQVAPVGPAPVSAGLWGYLPSWLGGAK